MSYSREKMATRLMSRAAEEVLEGDLRVETLCDNEWLSLKKMVYVEAGISGYIYSHEAACKGKKIVVLPFRKEPTNKLGFEILLRSEVTPCWHPTKPVISSITGGAEEDSTIEGDVVRELKEEAGYEVSESDLISLGTCYGTKSTDTIFYLFSVDLTGKDEGEASGDGSELEAKAHCYWASGPMGAQDPLVFTAWTKLLYSDDLKKALSV